MTQPDPTTPDRLTEQIEQGLEEALSAGYVEVRVVNGEREYRFTQAGYDHLAAAMAEDGIDPANREQVETQVADIVREWEADTL